MAAATSVNYEWAARYPDVGTEPLPVAPYISPEYFEAERQRVFRRCWLIVGRVEEAARPGDFFVRDMPPLNTSALVVRGNDGKLRAFHNMCKHRGNQVAATPRGNACESGFPCLFHGWTYDTQGRLAYVPDEQFFVGLDKSRTGLTPMACEVWEGFVFVHSDSAPSQSLTDFIGEILASYDGYFSTMKRVSSYQFDMNINWKVFVDVSVEGCHAAYVHVNNIARQFTGSDNPFLHLPSKRLYKLHRTVSIPADLSREPRPFEGLSHKYNAATSYTPTQAKNTAEGLPPGVNPDRVPSWAFDILSLFPNMVMLTAKGTYITMTFWPLSVNRTRVDAVFYMDPAKTLGERVGQEYTIAMMRDVIREDADTLEPVQRGLESGALTEIPFSDEEIACRHFYLTVDRMVKGGQ
jgi:phenylpropionate dioxygenase-like ring-hydroxylating dioxygenase large terminal subunit